MRLTLEQGHPEATFQLVRRMPTMVLVRQQATMVMLQSMPTMVLVRQQATMVMVQSMPTMVLVRQQATMVMVQSMPTMVLVRPQATTLLTHPGEVIRNFKLYPFFKMQIIPTFCKFVFQYYLPIMY